MRTRTTRSDGVYELWNIRIWLQDLWIQSGQMTCMQLFVPKIDLYLPASICLDLKPSFPCLVDDLVYKLLLIHVATP